MEDIKKHFEFILNFSIEISNKNVIENEDLNNLVREVEYFKVVVRRSNIEIKTKMSLLEIEFKNLPIIGYINYDNSRKSIAFLIVLRIMMAFSSYQSNVNQYQIEFKKMLYDFREKLQTKNYLFLYS